MNGSGENCGMSWTLTRSNIRRKASSLLPGSFTRALLNGDIKGFVMAYLRAK